MQITFRFCPDCNTPVQFGRGKPVSYIPRCQKCQQKRSDEYRRVFYQRHKQRFRNNRLRRLYPNIYDMFSNPAFAATAKTNKNIHNSRLAHFWNYIGARCNTPTPKFQCEICGDPIRKRRSRKYLVCKKHLNTYIAEVHAGTRIAKKYVPLVAA